MINVEILHKDDFVIGFNIVGHAGAATYGHDVVCAAVSAASDMVLVGLLEVIQIDIEYCSESGIMYCVLKDKENMSIKALQAVVLFQSFREYIRKVEAENSRFVKISDIFFTDINE